MGSPEPYTLHRVDMKTGDDLLKWSVETDPASPTCVSSDGGTIYYMKRDPAHKPRIMKYEIESRHSSVLFAAATPAARFGDHLVMSQDGHHIAIASLSGASSRWRIKVIPVSGGLATDFDDPAPLANPGEMNPVQWSSDGRELLIQRPNGMLWWIPMDGSRPRAKNARQLPPIQSIHKNGNHAAYTRGESHWAVSVLSDFLRQPASTDIFVAEIEPGTLRIHTPVRLNQNLVFSDAAPSFSPDGNLIAFKRRHLGDESGNNVHDVVILNTKTKEEKTFEANIGGSAPRWLHDHKNLLISMLNQNIRHLNREDGTAENATLRDSSLQFQTYGRGVPSLDNLLYLPAREVRADLPSEGPRARLFERIVLLDPLTGVQKSSFPVPGGVQSLGLSPDGSTLAVVAVHNTETGEAHLATIGVDGREFRVLCNFQAGAGASQINPIWTKNTILFGQWETADKLRLMKITVGGDKPQFTGLTVGNIMLYPTIDLSPDGKLLVFSSDEKSFSLNPVP